MTHQLSSPAPQQALGLREDQHQTGGTSLLWAESPRSLQALMCFHITWSCAPALSRLGWAGMGTVSQTSEEAAWGAELSPSLGICTPRLGRTMESVVWVQLVPAGGRCWAGRAGRSFPAGLPTRIWLQCLSHEFPKPVGSFFSPHENTDVLFLFHIAIAYCNDILQRQKIGTLGSASENYFCSIQLNPEYAILSFLTEPLSTFPQHMYFP